jgi:hypothetical protein
LTDTQEPPTTYADGYESIPQAEIDALTRDELLAIATDFGNRQLVRCTLDETGCGVEHGPGGIVSVDTENLRPVADAG